MKLYVSIDGPVAGRTLGRLLAELLAIPGDLSAQAAGKSREYSGIDVAKAAELGVFDDPEGWLIAGDVGSAHSSFGWNSLVVSLNPSKSEDGEVGRIAIDLVSAGADAVVLARDADLLRALGFGPGQQRSGVFGYSELVVLSEGVAEQVDLGGFEATSVRCEGGAVVLETSLDPEGLESLRRGLRDVLVSPIGDVWIPPGGPSLLPWLATTDRRRLAAEVVSWLKADEAAGSEPLASAMEFLQAFNPDDFLDPDPD